MDLFINLDALQTLYFRDFHGGFITSEWKIIKPISSPSPLSGEEGAGAESSNLLITRLGPLWTSPPSQVLFQTQLIIEKETRLSLSNFWNLKGFRNCVPGTKDKDQIYTYYKSHISYIWFPIPTGLLKYRSLGQSVGSQFCYCIHDWSLWNQNTKDNNMSLEGWCHQETFSKRQVFIEPLLYIG